MVSECCSALEKRSCLVCSVQASHPPNRSDETKPRFFSFFFISVFIDLHFAVYVRVVNLLV